MIEEGAELIDCLSLCFLSSFLRLERERESLLLSAKRPNLKSPIDGPTRGTQATMHILPPVHHSDSILTNEWAIHVLSVLVQEFSAPKMKIVSDV